MRRALRRLLPLLLVLALVAVPVAFALTARPDLEDARGQIDDRWDRLRPTLDERYEGLAAARDAAAATGLEADLLDELDRSLDEWSVRRREEDVAAEVRVANALEGLGTRLTAAASSAPRLAADETLGFALAVYGEGAPEAELVTGYSDAVERYEERRSDTLRRPLSGIFGFEERADFVPASEA